MGILRIAIVTLALVVPQVNAAAEQLPKLPPEVAAIAEALPGFQLREFVVEGRKPDLDALDEFLDLSDFDFHPVANGSRWFDVPYKATTARIHVGLGGGSGDKGGSTLWVRLDITKVRPGDVRRTALLTKLKARQPLAQGDYRIASDGALSVQLELDTNTVSENDVRDAIRTLFEQAEATRDVWRHSPY